MGLGGALFAGSKFVKWTLTPVILVALVAFPLLTTEWTVSRLLVVGSIEVTLACLLLGVLAPSRFLVAAGVSAAMVFLGYIGYFVDELLTDPSTLIHASRRSEVNAFNALRGLLQIGLPSLLLSIGLIQEWWDRRSGRVSDETPQDG